MIKLFWLPLSFLVHVLVCIACTQILKGHFVPAPFPLLNVTWKSVLHDKLPFLTEMLGAIVPPRDVAICWCGRGGGSERKHGGPSIEPKHCRLQASSWELIMCPNLEQKVSNTGKIRTLHQILTYHICPKPTREGLSKC